MVDKTSCCRETTAKELHSVDISAAGRVAEPSATIAAAQGVEAGQPEETREAPVDQVGPQDQVPEHPERMNKDVTTEPSSHLEPWASPQAQMLGMELIPSVQP